MAQVTPGRRPLQRGRHRILGGVCSGLAATLDVDPTLVRIAFVLLAFAHGLGILLYILLWVLVPEEGREGPWTVGSAAGAVREDVSRVGADLKAALQPAASTPPAPPPAAATAPPAAAADPSPTSPAPPVATARRSIWPGVLLVGVGVLLLADNFGWLWWSWSIGAPVLLIAAGIWLLARRRP